MVNVNHRITWVAFTNNINSNTMGKNAKFFPLDFDDIYSSGTSSLPPAERSFFVDDSREKINIYRVYVYIV